MGRGDAVGGFDGAGVSATALAAAAGRAVEASRVDALVADPYAATLVRAARSPLELPTSWPQDPTNAPPAQQPLLLASVYVGDFLLAAPQPSLRIAEGWLGWVEDRDWPPSMPRVDTRQPG